MELQTRRGNGDGDLDRRAIRLVTPKICLRERDQHIRAIEPSLRDIHRVLTQTRRASKDDVVTCSRFGRIVHQPLGRCS